ncbi:hypothetical protein OO012_06615 [Rhodobacteraceae bacterium KMM 6894]|nr:hypothetical protein [Rhodobacteraceae bacterium KMM 6894]
MKPYAYPMHCAQRCAAKSKRTGLPCKSPAVRGWTVCRMHGARGGAQPGKAHPNYRHGARGLDAVALRRVINFLNSESRSTVQELAEPTRAPDAQTTAQCVQKT